MILAGDFVPQKADFSLPDFGDEIVLANLEGPICEDGLKPIEKVGIHLHTAPLELTGRWAFSLANNHLMDFRAEGLYQTVAYLKQRNIPFAGAGDNEMQARRPMWIVEGGKQIAVISCCERQFGAADIKHPGVAVMGDWVPDLIRDVKKREADFVIVSCHRGSELSKFVSPRLVEIYHSYIEAGADVVHGHHAHVPQGWETYDGKPIFYGLGNFIVDAGNWQGDPNYLWSLIARMKFEGSKIAWTVEPIGRVPVTFDEYVKECNAIFSDRDLLERRWRENCIKQYNKFYKPYLRISLRSLFGWFSRPRQQWLLQKCFSECETHKDIIATAERGS